MIQIEMLKCQTPAVTHVKVKSSSLECKDPVNSLKWLTCIIIALVCSILLWRVLSLDQEMFARFCKAETSRSLFTPVNE